MGQMPCSDVTEFVELELDARECVRRFHLTKRTCGAPVGRALLFPYLDGMNPEALIERSLDSLLPPTAELRRRDEFLLKKELHALQAALRVYLGRTAGAPSDTFTLASVEHDRDGTTISGHLRVDLVTENIRACGGCGGAAQRDG
jgi:hypothetical protein